MNVKAAAFAGIEAMVSARRPGVDEVEVVYTPPPPNHAHHALPGMVIRRDGVMRLIKFLSASERASSRRTRSGKARRRAAVPTDTVDVSVDGGVRLTLRKGPSATYGTPVTVAPSGTPPGALPGAPPGASMEVVEAMRKDRVRPPVSIPEYRMRFNMKSELPPSEAEVRAAVAALALPARTGERRVYRMKRRYSFALSPLSSLSPLSPLSPTADQLGRPPLKGAPERIARIAVRVDVTAVRQLEQVHGEGPATLGDVARMPERYEVEVELLAVPPGLVAAQVAKQLLSHFLAVLKCLDETDGCRVLSTDEQSAVLLEYGRLVGDPAASSAATVSSIRFVGPQPVTLETRNVDGTAPSGVPDILRDYTVTHKADGERRLLFVAADRRAYTVNSRMFVRDTGRSLRKLSRCLLDGEQVASVEAAASTGDETDRPATFHAFDAYFVNGIDTRSLPLFPRGVPDVPDAPPESPEEDGKQSQEPAVTTGGSSSSTSRKARQRRQGQKMQQLESGKVEGGRLDAARSVLADLEPTDVVSPSAIRVELKEFRRTGVGAKALAEACRSMFARQRSGKLPFTVDGLIFTPAFAPVPQQGGTWGEVLKWKPPEQNTVDFQVRMHPPDQLAVVEDGGKGMCGPATPCRVATLLVGTNPWLLRPVSAMDFLTGAAAHRYRELRGKYVATPFVPEAHPSQPPSFDPSECFLRLPNQPQDAAGAAGAAAPQPTCESGEQILDGMIVEFSYASGPTQGGLPAFHPARWRPLRVRWDKTEEHLLTGKVKANNLATAGAVWRSIHSPISREILSDAERIAALAGDARPVAGVQKTLKDGQKDDKKEQQEQTEYYVVAGSKGRGSASADDAIRTFHNHGIKRDALLARFPASSGLGRSLFDFGCGRGGDLGRWLSMGAERIVGIDKYASNLYNPDEDVGGAHVRVLKQRMKQNQNGGRSSFPRIAFLPMDASLPLSDPTNSGVPWTVPGHSPDGPEGTALTASAIAETDRKVAAVLWGRTTAEDARRLKLGDFHGFASAQFDLATCMFAVHYFFDARKSLATFAANVGRVLRPGGHFAGCCLDGALVDALLAREAPKPGDTVGSAVGTWRVTRRYSGGPGVTSGDPDVAFGTDVAFGRRIDVRMASIGQEVPEYLVDYATLVEVMAKHGGLVPVNDEKARTLGLVGGHSTGLFEQAHEAWVAAGGVGGAVLSDDDKKYSFLHRWFVFVKA